MTPDVRRPARLEIARRDSALGGLPPFPITHKVKLIGTGSLTRLSFRGSPKAAAEMTRAFGPELSTRPLTASEAGGRAALWLGPDEWLLVARDGEVDAILTVVKALVHEPVSIVDVSQRNTGIVLSGPQAAEALACGCPLDLHAEAFPPGTVARTLLGKAEIVLWRQAPERFQLEVWRSMVAYVQAFMAAATSEYMTG